jgi:hypothetical protein
MAALPERAASCRAAERPTDVLSLCGALALDLEPSPLALRVVTRCPRLTWRDLDSRSARRTSIRHPPPTLRRASPSSHTLTTRSSQQPDLWTTRLSNAIRQRRARWRSSQKVQHRSVVSLAANGPSEAGQFSRNTWSVSLTPGLSPGRRRGPEASPRLRRAGTPPQLDLAGNPPTAGRGTGRRGRAPAATRPHRAVRARCRGRAAATGRQDSATPRWQAAGPLGGVRRRLRPGREREHRMCRTPS